MSAARAGSRQRNPGRGKQAAPGVSVRGLAVAKKHSLTNLHKKQFELVCEVKPDWTDEEIIMFCRKCNYDPSIIQQGLMNAFEDLLPSQDQNAEQWSVIGKKPRKKRPEGRGEDRNQRDGRERRDQRDRDGRRAPRKDSNGRPERRERSSEQPPSSKKAQPRRGSMLRSEPKPMGVWARRSQKQASEPPSASPAVEVEVPGASVPPVVQPQPAVDPAKPTYATLLKRGIEKAARQQQLRLAEPVESAAPATISTVVVEESFTVIESSGWENVEVASSTAEPAEESESDAEGVAVEVIEAEIDVDITEASSEQDAVYIEPESVAAPAAAAAPSRVHMLFAAGDPVILPEHLTSRASAIDSTMIQFGNFGISGAPVEEPVFLQEPAPVADSFPVQVQTSTNQQLLQQQLSQMTGSDAAAVPPAEDVIREDSAADAEGPTSQAPDETVSHYAQGTASGVTHAPSPQPQQPSEQQPQHAQQQQPHQQQQQPVHAQHLQAGVMYSHQAQYGAPQDAAGPPHPQSSNQFGGFVPVHSLPGNAPYTISAPHSYMHYESEHQGVAPHAYYDPYSGAHQPQQRSGGQRPQRGSSYRANKSRSNRERGSGRSGGYGGDRGAMKQQGADKVVDGSGAPAGSSGKDAKFGQDTRQGGGGRNKRHYQQQQGGGQARYPVQQQQHHAPAAYGQGGPAPPPPPMGYAPSAGLYSYPAPYTVPPFYGQSQGYGPPPPPPGYGRHYAFQGAAAPSAAAAASHHYANFASRAAAPYPGQTAAYEGAAGMAALYASARAHPDADADDDGAPVATNAAAADDAVANECAAKHAGAPQVYEQGWPMHASDVPSMHANDAQQAAAMAAAAAAPQGGAAAAAGGAQAAVPQGAAASSEAFDRRGGATPPPAPNAYGYPAQFGQAAPAAAFAGFAGAQQAAAQAPAAGAYGEAARAYPHWTQ